MFDTGHDNENIDMELVQGVDHLSMNRFNKLIVALIKLSDFDISHSVKVAAIERFTRLVQEKKNRETQFMEFMTAP